ncbi:MAG: EF-hand domain-containing protein [Rhodospirillales bacterium]|nr:EF-hand domain-containing protein [Rhodospirillales bacterium]
MMSVNDNPALQVGALIMLMDENGDGTISKTEYLLSGLLLIRFANDEMTEAEWDRVFLPRIFGHFDYNGDGALDRGELESSVKVLGKYENDQSSIDEAMIGHDRNGDGVISFEEFKETARP